MHSRWTSPRQGQITASRRPEQRSCVPAMAVIANRFQDVVMKP